MQEAPLMENYINEGEFDFNAFHEDNMKFQMEMKAKRFRMKIMQHYGITDEEWKNTPLTVQAVLADLNNEIERYAETMYELESWRDSMPI